MYPILLVSCPFCIRTIPCPFKNGIWGRGVVLKFHFKFQFLPSCFLNDQYSSSFQVVGKQLKINYLCLLVPDWSSTCVGMASHPKIALPWSYWKSQAQVFSNQCPRLGKNCYFTIPFGGWISIPRFPSKKNVEFDRLVLSPVHPPPCRGNLHSGLKNVCSEYPPPTQHRFDVWCDDFLMLAAFCSSIRAHNSL